MASSRSAGDLGQMGENTFLLLCKDTGFVANTSDDDKGGWDVEIEHFRGNDFNFSNHSYFVGRIQVKASQQQNMSVAMTFSNLLNLIQFNGAAYIVYFEYGEAGLMPSRGFLREVDEALSREILVALRQRQNSNKRFRLNKNKYTVKFSDAHLLDELTGACLREVINENVGYDYKDYISRKLDYLNQFEKETGRFAVTMSINGEKGNLNRFIDAFLGYDVSFQGRSRIFSTTMGVADNTNPDQNDAEQEMPLKLGPKEDEQPIVTVSISFEPHGKQYSFPGILFSTPSFIPEALHKHRIKTALFDMLLETAEVSGEFTMKPSFTFIDIFEQNVVTSLKDFFLLNEVMEKSIQFDAFYVTINAEDNPAKMSPMKLPYNKPKLPEEFEYFKGAVDALYGKASALNIVDERISSDELTDKRDKLYLFSKERFDFEKQTKMEFNTSSAERISAKRMKLFDSVIFSLEIKFEHKILVSLFLFHGSVSSVGGTRYEGCFDKAEHKKDLLFEADQPDITQLVSDAEKILHKQFRKDGSNPFDIDN